MLDSGNTCVGAGLGDCAFVALAVSNSALVLAVMDMDVNGLKRRKQQWIHLANKERYCLCSTPPLQTKKFISTIWHLAALRNSSIAAGPARNQEAQIRSNRQSIPRHA